MTETGMATFPIDLGVLVAVTTTSSKLAATLVSRGTCAKASTTNREKTNEKNTLILLKSVAKLVQQRSSIITELSDQLAT
jgi:hypothetical protein